MLVHLSLLVWVHLYLYSFSWVHLYLHPCTWAHFYCILALLLYLFVWVHMYCMLVCLYLCICTESTCIAHLYLSPLVLHLLVWVDLYCTCLFELTCTKWRQVWAVAAPRLSSRKQVIPAPLPPSSLHQIQSYKYCSTNKAVQIHKFYKYSITIRY